MKNNLFKILPIAIIIAIGILLRLKGWILNPSMWHDECNLAVSIIDFNLFDYFTKRLELGQVAPPLFMVLTKLLTNIFGINDRTLRILPEICSVLSLILFYLLSKEVLNTKLAKISVLTAFALNSAIIYYASEFKQYGCDVFSTLLVLLLFIRIYQGTNLNTKKIIITTITMIIISWFSFISILGIAAGIILLLSKKETRKSSLLIAIPLIISGLIYTKVILMQTYTDSFMVKNWNNEFVKFNLTNLPILFINSIKYFLAPIKMVLFPMIFFFIGLFTFIKEKQIKALPLVLTFLFTIGLSMLKIYPYAERVILFLLPIYLILIFKTLDIQNRARFIILALIILAYLPQFMININYLKVKSVYKKEPAREFAQHLAETAKKSDLIFVNSASKSEFLYYKYIYNIENDVIFEEPENNVSENRINLLKTQLEQIKGSTWFYMPYDIPHRAVSNEIAGWLLNNKEPYENYNIGTSNLIHIEL